MNGSGSAEGWVPVGRAVSVNQKTVTPYAFAASTTGW